MVGSSPTMATAVRQQHSPSSSFSRSHSSPELLSLGSPGRPSMVSSSHSKHRAKPRPSYKDKSLPELPAFDVPSFDSHCDFELSFSRDRGDGRRTSIASASEAIPTLMTPAPDVHERPSRLNTARLKTATNFIDRPRSWMPNLKVARELSTTNHDPRPATSATDMAFAGAPTESAAPRPLQRSLTVSEGFASFAKRSWRSSSRSPSSTNRSAVAGDSLTPHDATKRGDTARARSPRAMGVDATETEASTATTPTKTTPKAFSRATNYFSKMKQRQSPVVAIRSSNYPDSNNSRASSVTSLATPISNSADTSTSQSTCSEGTATTPTTDDSSNEMTPQARDSLFSSFRTLDMEFKGFPSKQTNQKVAQVQSLLVPFLRSTMNHASNKSLRPEDVDRRATVLNKWWIAILDMLNGLTQQPIPGVDRPILLEAAAMIMMRPEWRLATSSFRPLADRLPTERVRSRSWTNASESTRSSAQSAMLAESAEHNVRTMFVSNLVKQMAFVVDKMSLRHAPVTLVNFAGKSCAYAFFFVPGVADILIRLWNLTPELIRRAAGELGLPRKDTGDSDDIVALFPPKLGIFGWTSPRAMWESLKQIPKMSMLVASVNWTQSWVSRWKGRDTDLFYIFCKYFHVLSDQFMPPNLPLTEKARAPAFVLVQAQLLSITDNTIHRQSTVDSLHGGSLVDSMNGPDASVLAIPMPATHLMKSMSENRLVILLRDFLSDDATEFAGAKHTFAEAFEAMVKAATRKTSQFNSAACITLCDFLEEVFTVYSKNLPTCGLNGYLRLEFWVGVFKLILSSMNTMAEVRMLSFLYNIWDALASDSTSKLSLCKNWLLTEETFNNLFNHWCPMVRAYYHRLLCWRICRDEGRASEVDAKIFSIATQRLKTAWAHYLYLKYDAAVSDRLPPSTAPMSPTVGKKFIIIRQEVNPPQPGLFMGFDSFARTPGQDPRSSGGIADGGLPKSDAKKRWSLLGKVLSFAGSGADAGEEHSKRGSMEDQLRIARHEVHESRKSGVPVPPPKALRRNSATGMPELDSGASSPVFEEQKYVFRFFLGWQQPPMPARERILARPRLPAPAQSRVAAGDRYKDSLPPRLGLPEATRSFSGSSQTGLVHAAKNASPLGSPAEDSRRRSSSVGFSELVRSSLDRTSLESGDYFSAHSCLSSHGTESREGSPGIPMEPSTKPLKPAGMYAKTAIYGGRALAEWGIVVNECNVFVDRRRDEGVLGLSEVEIPVLGVEGFRRPG